MEDFILFTESWFIYLLLALIDELISYNCRLARRSKSSYD